MANASKVSPGVLEYVAKLPSGSHAVFCYDRQPEVTHIFASYLKGAMDRNEAMHVLAANERVYRKFVQHALGRTEALQKDRHLGCQLISETLVDQGRLSSAKARRSSVELLQQDRQRGFQGARLFGLYTEQYFEYASPADLLGYEQEPSFNLPVSAICTYNAGRLAGLGLHNLVLNVFQVHGQIIGKGIAFARA